MNEEILRAVEEERMRRLGLNPDEPQVSSANKKTSVNTRDSTKQARDSVKRKFDEDFDDVFSFSAQESKVVKNSSERPSGSTSSSSMGKWTPRTSIEAPETKLKFEPSAIKSQRPNTLSKNFAHKFHESVLHSTRQKELLRVTGKWSSLMLSSANSYQGTKNALFLSHLTSFRFFKTYHMVIHTVEDISHGHSYSRSCNHIIAEI